MREPSQTQDRFTITKEGESRLRCSCEDHRLWRSRGYIRRPIVASLFSPMQQLCGDDEPLPSRFSVVGIAHIQCEVDVMMH
jgi:hypothetical protein